MNSNWFKLVMKMTKVEYGKNLLLKGVPIIFNKGGAKLKIGENATIKSSFLSNLVGLYSRTIIVTRAPGAEIEIGDNVGISGATIYARKKITIGENTCIGGNCKILDNDFHPIETETRNKLLRDENGGDSDLVPSREIKIGKNCFIGCNSIILKGTVLGDADDKFHDSEVLETLLANQELDDDVIYGNTVRVSRDEKWMTKADPIEFMKWNMPFCHQSSITKTSIMKTEFFDLAYRVADYNFFLRLYLNGGTFKYVDLIIADYSMNGYSNQEKYKTYLGTLKIKEDLGLVDAKSLTQKIKNIYFKLLLSENSWIGNIVSSIDDIYRKYKKREIIK